MNPLVRSISLAAQARAPRLITLVACAWLTGASLAHADELIGWNQMLFRAGLVAGTSPTTMSRVAAIVHAAMFDAVNGIDRRYTPVRVAPAAPNGASRDAAVAYAAYTTLVALYPAQKGLFDTKLAVSVALTTARDGAAAVAGGAGWGQLVANEILTWRAGDGFNAVLPPYLGSTLVGMWRPTPPANAPGAAVDACHDDPLGHLRRHGHSGRLARRP